MFKYERRDTPPEGDGRIPIFRITDWNLQGGNVR